MFTLKIGFSGFTRKRSVKPAVSDWRFADWCICDADRRNFVPDKTLLQNRRFANQKFEEFHQSGACKATLIRNEVTLIQANLE